MENKEKLKPCPFCGKNAKLEVLGSFGPVDYPDLSMNFWWVRCKCGVTAMASKYKACAIKAWNRRK